MSTKVTFETATIADVLKKAEVCSPRATSSEDAMSPSAGIMMEVDPAAQRVTVRATNRETFYREQVDFVEMSGAPAAWRIPGTKFTGIVAGLPLGSGATVEFSNDDSGLLHLKSARTRGKVFLMDAWGYPTWGTYAPPATEPVEGLAKLISRVSWACDDQEVPFTGVRFCGNYLTAANRWRAARVPCSLPALVGNERTVPVKLLTPVIRNAREVRVSTDGNFLTLSPDDHTQILSTIFDKNLPPTRFMDYAYSTSTTLDRAMLLDTVKRMLNITKGSDEIPVVKAMLGDESLTLRVEGRGGESIEDVIDLPGQAKHFPVLLSFFSNTLTECVSKAGNDQIALLYDDAPASPNKVVSFDCGDGYRSWFVQWKGLPPTNERDS